VKLARSAVEKVEFEFSGCGDPAVWAGGIHGSGDVVTHEIGGVVLFVISAVCSQSRSSSSTYMIKVNDTFTSK
jgi:hypothetical protein